jgi:predicted acylesterase/phospholipase RssA
MKPRRPRIALALAGGGPLGAIYEVGALCALQESLSGVDFTQLHSYVGVSAGGFLAAGLANGITPRELCDSFIASDDVSSGDDIFDPSWLLRPAYTEYARRAASLPAALWKAAFGGLRELGQLIPTGVFSNDDIHTRLTGLFSKPGRTNDFRQLKTRLVLVATNLDSAAPAAFGTPGLDHVPISKAVQASSALPGLFPPVLVDGQYFCDGALTKTVHASVLLDEGVDLLLCLNPLVPFDATKPLTPRVMSRGKAHIPRMVDGGLPTVLSQTFRAMIHSRMELGMKHYERAYPGTTIVLFEPDHRDPEMFLANTFSYAQRRELAEHAYQATRHTMRSYKTWLTQQLSPHGVRLRLDVLEDDQRRLLAPATRTTKGRPPARPGTRAVQQLQEVLDDLERLCGGARSAAPAAGPRLG